MDAMKRERDRNAALVLKQATPLGKPGGVYTTRQGPQKVAVIAPRDEPCEFGSH